MDYYEVLGVEKDATLENIKRSYRRLALQSHPDLCPADTEAGFLFRVITEAYKMLSDPEKRILYDRGFLPIASLQDLFRRHQGKQFISKKIPHAPLESVRGADQVVVVHEDISGSVCVKKGATDIVFDAENGYTWCCIAGLGGHGQNGGDNGDLYVFVIKKKE